MEINEVVEGHGRAIEELNKKTESIEKSIDKLDKNFEGISVKIEEQNKYLREQNNNILSAVLNRNEKSDAQKHELSMLNWSNLWKVLAVAAGAGGFMGLIIQALIKN